MTTALNLIGLTLTSEHVLVQETRVVADPTKSLHSRRLRSSVLFGASGIQLLMTYAINTAPSITSGFWYIPILKVYQQNTQLSSSVSHTSTRTRSFTDRAVTSLNNAGAMHQLPYTNLSALPDHAMSDEQEAHDAIGMHERFSARQLHSLPHIFRV